MTALPLEITNLYARYVFGVDGQDLDLLESCFHPEAVYEVRDVYRVEGRPAILKRIATRWQPGNRHLTHDLLVDLDPQGTSASCRARFVVTAENGRQLSTGEYDDVLSWREDGGWRFETRCIRYGWRAADGGR